jgi:hypothetical protein
LELTHETLLEEALVFNVANLLAEVTGGTRFGVGPRLGLLLEGGGGGIGSKDRRGRLPVGRLQVPEALDDICLAELVHNSKSVDHSMCCRTRWGKKAQVY